MTIDLQPAGSDDYAFALHLYVKTIRPLATAWMEWVDEDQEAQFASLWRPGDTKIIVLDGREDIGWVEVRQTGDEVFLKQLYTSPAHQRRGFGSHIMRLLLEERCGAAKSMALFVLKNNPAFRFYQRHGFHVVREPRLSSSCVVGWLRRLDPAAPDCRIDVQYLRRTDSREEP